MSRLKIVLSGLRVPKDSAGLTEAFAPDEPEFVVASEADEIKRAVADADCLIAGTSKITAEVVAAGKRLRLIQKAGLRYENIDLDATRKAGIPVYVSRKLGRIQIAEHAFALILALRRKILPAHEAVIHCDYEKEGIQPIVADQTHFVANWVGYGGITTLFGQTLAILGLGEIGTEVALHGKAFGMNVLYTQRRRIDPAAERQLGAAYVSLEELLRRADVLVVCVPQTPATEGMIGADELSLLKKSSYLINVAKGAVVKEAALAESLRAGNLAGAGLDVFSQEPLPRSHPLLQSPNVVLTPHLAMGETAGGNLGDELKMIFAAAGRALRGVEPEGRVV